MRAISIFFFSSLLLAAQVQAQTITTTPNLSLSGSVTTGDVVVGGSNSTNVQDSNHFYEQMPETTSNGTTGTGTEASPFVNSDNTAGMQTLINSFNSGRGGTINLASGRHNVSATTVINDPGTSIGCPSFTFNRDGAVIAGNAPAIWGCTIIPQTALTNGVFEYGTGAFSQRIASSNLTNVYAWGQGTADNSKGIFVNLPTNVAHWDSVSFGGFQYGMYHGPNSVAKSSCDTCSIFQSNFVANAFGILIDTGSLGFTNPHIIANDISDNLQDGYIDASAAAPYPPMVMGNDIIRNAKVLTSFTGSIGATFTGTGSGTNLTASAVNGVIHPGSALSATITGTGVPGSTYIVSQTSGTTGGAGVYVTNNSTTSSGAAITDASTTLDVTATTVGYLVAGKYINGTGISVNTVHVSSQTSGTSGGVGVYVIDTALTIASETMTAPGANVYTNTTQGYEFLGNVIVEAGQYPPGNVSADGVILAGTNAMVMGNQFVHQDNGCGLRATGSYNIVSSNNFFGGTRTCDVKFDVSSFNNVLFSPWPLSFSDLGTHNIGIYADTSQSWTVYGDADPTVVVKASPSSLFGATLNLDATAVTSGQKWQLQAAGAGVGNGNLNIYDYGTSRNVITIATTTDLVSVLFGMTLSGTVTMPDASVWNSTKLALAPAGTTSNPTLTFTNCGTNCGILAPAANQLETVVGGVNKMDYGVTNAGVWQFNAAIIGSGNITAGGGSQFSWFGRDVLTSPSTTAIHVGTIDAAAATSHTFGMQGIVAGNGNTAAGNFTISGGLSNGSGGGDLILSTTLSTAASGTQNVAATALTLKGGSQNVLFSALAVMKGFTVSGLPGGVTGAHAYVTDQLTTCAVPGAALTGGGAVTCPVFYNGSAWVGG